MTREFTEEHKGHQGERAPSELLADICRTAQVKAIGNPALTHRGRTGYRPCETHLPGFATFTYSELVFAQLKCLGVPGELSRWVSSKGLGVSV